MNSASTSQTFPSSNPLSAAAAAPPPPPGSSTSTGHPPAEPWRRALAKYAGAVFGGATPDIRAVPSLLKACAAAGAVALAVNLHQRPSSLATTRTLMSPPPSSTPTRSSDTWQAPAECSMKCHAGPPFPGPPSSPPTPISPAIRTPPWQRTRGCGAKASNPTPSPSWGCSPESGRRLSCSASTPRRQKRASVSSPGGQLLGQRLLEARKSELRPPPFPLNASPDVISWNTMISGLFSRRSPQRLSGAIQEDDGGRRFCSRSADLLLSGLLRRRYRWIGSCRKSIHGLIITSGVDLDDGVVTSLLTMYLRQKNLSYGYLLFDLAAKRDSVFWTAMTAGLVQNDRADEALKRFPRALISSLVSCPPPPVLSRGLRATCLYPWLPPPPEHDPHGPTGGELSDQHVFQVRPHEAEPAAFLGDAGERPGFLELCDLRFRPEWRSGDGLPLLEKMVETGLRPDSITVLLLLKGSASLGSLRHGRPLHGFLVRNQQWPPAVAAMTALVDMYCKCGELRVARSCFDSIMAAERDLVSWSSMIAGYGSHGSGEAALELFSAFLSTGIPPNRVVFLAALSACSHAGLVGDGLRIFRSMAEDFGLSPEMEHCACVVDLLGRAGMLREAAAVARSTPTSEVLGILLDASRTHGDAALAEEVAAEILAMEPAAAGSYVQLAQGFSAASRWDAVGESWARMRSLGLKKTPGWSSVEVNGAAAATFFVGQSSHPQHGELTSLLRNLYKEMRSAAADDDDEDKD
ncbi:unnamed protein product [Spirodela intermedia]|uniref:Uncharacterized protein n=1 Tax=Spirodela intermedia TaxID=51605 RepID=A0A7I8JTW0_SPIIN|nr:unnamed protein product [Spirodela intermedia]CAA6673191.1 unnamed protein product [Spirodela intermedia]